MSARRWASPRWCRSAARPTGRKVDYNVLSAVAGLGQSAMKMATDIRLLANFKGDGGAL